MSRMSFDAEYEEHLEHVRRIADANEEAETQRNWRETRQSWDQRQARRPQPPTNFDAFREDYRRANRSSELPEDANTNELFANLRIGEILQSGRRSNSARPRDRDTLAEGRRASPVEQNGRIEPPERGIWSRNPNPQPLIVPPNVQAPAWMTAEEIYSALREAFGRDIPQHGNITIISRGRDSGNLEVGWSRYGQHNSNATRLRNIFHAPIPRDNRPPPASRSAIAQLGTKQIAADEDGHRCGICFDEKHIGETVMILPCLHWFDKGCIEPWLRQNGTCPTCRTRIEEGGAETTTNLGNSIDDDERAAQRARHFLLRTVDRGPEEFPGETLHFQPATNAEPSPRLGAAQLDIPPLSRAMHFDLDWAQLEIRFPPVTDPGPLPRPRTRNPRREVERQRDQAGHGFHAGMAGLGAELFTHVGHRESAATSDVDLFPTRPLEAADRHANRQLICKICLAAKQVGNSVMELPCGDWFCRDCARAWLREHSTCPTCRVRVDFPQS